jgi:sugar/nucleoside kinase (ribokinase family)
MPHDPPPSARKPLRLLVVGGLTIDSFPDGAAWPGGAVLHGGLAAASIGAAVTFLTVAGGEPVARDGLARLEAAGELRAQHADRTIGFAHRPQDGRRELVYLGGGAPIRLAAADSMGSFDAVVLAPVADELPSDELTDALSLGAPAVTVLLAQGWLRSLAPGEPVVARHPDALPAALWSALAAADAIVCSVDDLHPLAGAAGEPAGQLLWLRAQMGDGPVIVLTDGANGCVVSERGGGAVAAVAPPRAISDVPEAALVGAGDAFGTCFALQLAAGASGLDAAAGATAQVVHWLERRSAGTSVD